MKTHIRSGVAGPGIEAAIPSLYRPLMRPGMRRLSEAHLLLFPQHVVTTSTAAKRALAKLEALPEASSFAFAHDATVEARALLEGAGVKVFTLRSFGWTDAMYRELHGNTGV